LVQVLVQPARVTVTVNVYEFVVAPAITQTLALLVLLLAVNEPLPEIAHWNVAPSAGVLDTL
jgi:hypothetical protein